MALGGGNILVALCGLSPQVVTETLYALSVNRDPAVHFARIVVLTTAATETEREHRENLWERLDAKVEEFYRVHPPPGHEPPPELEVNILGDGQGRPIRDLSTPEESRLAADFIFRHVRKLTDDPTSRIWASLAGGRKTVSAYLALAFSILARPGDSLNHVLVSERIEKDRDFYFPTKGTPAGMAREISLVQVPVPMLRGRLEVLLRRQDLTFDILLREAQELLKPRGEVEPLVASARRRTVTVGGTNVALGPEYMQIYLRFLRRRLACCARPQCEGCERSTLTLGDLGGSRRSGTLRSTISRINRSLRTAIDYSLPYEIRHVPPAKEGRYGLAVPRHLIRIVE